MPLLIVFYVLAYIGRSNLGYAALEMNVDLGITDAAFGLIAGIFFLGYFLFEVPSNILLDRFGARVWIARILVTWGIVIVATGFVQNVEQLYLARFALGLAEAGFFPGVILYLSRWYLGRDAAKAVSIFMVAIPVSYMIGSPISGWIMDHANWLDLASWRWLFILEGIPSILGGIVCYFALPDAAKTATWLTPSEKGWLQKHLSAEASLKPARTRRHFSKETWFNGKIWALILVYFAISMCDYGVGFWTPLIVDRIGSNLSATSVGFITSATYVLGAVAMIWWGRRSDGLRERRWHIILPALLCSLALGGIGSFSESMVAVVFLAVIIATVYAMFAPFWALQSYFLTGAAAVVGIAMINSFGNLAGAVTPYLIGAMSDLTGNRFAGFYVMALIMLAATWVVAKSVRTEQLRQQEDLAQTNAEAAIEADTPVGNAGTEQRS